MKDFECLEHSSGGMNVRIKKKKKDGKGEILRVRLWPVCGKCLRASVYSLAWKYFLYSILLVTGGSVDLVKLEDRGLDRKRSLAQCRIPQSRLYSERRDNTALRVHWPQARERRAWGHWEKSVQR